MANEKRPKFGNRFLTEESNVFTHNAWDDVSWNIEMEEAAKIKLQENSKHIIPAEEQEKYEAKANAFWDDFYKKHKTGFFKDRHWLFTEFPELCSQSTNAKEIKENSCEPTDSISTSLCVKQKTILEVGCGAGNSVFPIIDACQCDELFVYCCDFSEVAVSLVTSHPNFDSQKCQPFVLDITSETWNVPFPVESIDCILLVFVLSALHPDKVQNALNHLVKYLKPGGRICFRDYGRYDMAELRFKPGHCLSDHYYVRGDGTRAYFFSEDEVHKLFCAAGLTKLECKVDRRMQVNRGKLLKMYRIWIQATYAKPLAT